MRIHSTTSRWAGICAGLLLCALFLSERGFAQANGKTATPRSQWDARTAAHYLDSREAWWQGWDHAKRDHDTRCVSCHTQAPYALARPELRSILGDSSLSAGEKAMLADVEKRVREWDTMLPFYSDQKYGEGKELESRNAEAVLNAIILGSYDQAKKQLGDLTRIAFDHAWASQSKTGPDAGAWVWQNFDYAPWESKDSQYHWAALMLMEVNRAPGGYAREAKVAASVELLRDYLRSHYQAQPLLNKIAALWAAGRDEALITTAQKKALAEELGSRQHPDGGWSLNDLGTWQRRDNSPPETRSDGYATALIVLALEKSGIIEDPRFGPVTTTGAEHALRWISSNQDKTTGSWPAWSVNKNRDLQSDAGLFMTDAATAYAVMALDSRAPSR